MADMSVAERKTVIAGFHGGSAKVRLTPALPASRVSLRAGADAVAGLSKSLGVKLPTKPKTSAATKGRTAFWLGPDEWLLIDETGSDLMADCAASGVLHSATDISHRNTAIIVSGPAAAGTINSASPLDLSLAAFPVGAVTRSVFGKIEIILYRVEEETFRIECWRSFAEYAFGMLAEGAEDASL
ncbi:sarcosine oxidase subunit gamma [Rhizobium sp. Root274]|uniref:sarcosine oxidase subunit gamma n=1 Tax=unclassified Rhizobium TaxID=2613769 RepID=UPI000714B314|nr:MULTISPECIES: sarcosine oxidase subunit gamma [unclassified Rhizobium]KQW29365.1 sarcosine oxidase subunit gamma [Rhizobium sp. Root1240]KRD29557.1 sarcosine oxidase subunit gamma [Rhizobium sp. Root274]